MIAPGLLLVATIRVVGSLLVLRWALAGGLAAILVDLSDLFFFDLFDLFAVADYQRFDKVLDQVYLAAFLLVALRWVGVERRVAVGLYAFRLVGFVAYELTGERALLLLFPNVFELWFMLVAALRHRATPVRWTAARLVGALAVLTLLKELHEWALHGARLFDGIGALEALELVRRAVFGP